MKEGKFAKMEREDSKYREKVERKRKRIEKIEERQRREQKRIEDNLVCHDFNNEGGNSVPFDIRENENEHDSWEPELKKQRKPKKDDLIAIKIKNSLSE